MYGLLLKKIKGREPSSYPVFEINGKNITEPKEKADALADQ